VIAKLVRERAGELVKLAEELEGYGRMLTTSIPPRTLT